MGVAGLAPKTLDAGDGRHRRRRKYADRGDQKPRIVVPAILQNDGPAARILPVTRGGDAAVELDVATQIELVGDVVQITLGLGLAREVLLPVPFVQQFREKE